MQPTDAPLPRSLPSDELLRREIARCRAEIAHVEALLRAGHPDVHGLCLALTDWSQELRILARLANLPSLGHLSDQCGGGAYKRPGNENKTMKNVTKKNTAAQPAKTTDTVIAQFATGLRAASLVEDLATAGITSQTSAPKWTNKKLPPPRIAVTTAPEDAARATELYKEWNTPGAKTPAPTEAPVEKTDAAAAKTAKAKPVSAAKAKRAVHAAVDTFVKTAAAKAASKKTPAKTSAKKTAAKGAAKAPRAESKTAKIIALLERKGGATAPELLKATGWQAHSLRGFISGTLGKKMGRPAKSDINTKGERVYSL